jgi:hypothetical protein
LRSASSALNTMWPLAAPGLAGSPLASSFFGAGSMRGVQQLVDGRRSTRRIASRSLMSPSFTISTAMRTAARAVRFPVRHWSM